MSLHDEVGDGKGDRPECIEDEDDSEESPIHVGE